MTYLTTDVINEVTGRVSDGAEFWDVCVLLLRNHRLGPINKLMSND